MPPLVVWGNPPERASRQMRGLPRGARLVGKIAATVHEIKYQHAADDEPYSHLFEHDSPAEMWAIEFPDGRRAVMITGRDGQPLWDDFQ